MVFFKGDSALFRLGERSFNQNVRTCTIKSVQQKRTKVVKFYCSLYPQWKSIPIRWYIVTGIVNASGFNFNLQAKISGWAMRRAQNATRAEAKIKIDLIKPKISRSTSTLPQTFWRVATKLNGYRIIGATQNRRAAREIRVHWPRSQGTKNWLRIFMLQPCLSRPTSMMRKTRTPQPRQMALYILDNVINN